MEQSGAKYAALYVSDPFRSISYPLYRELERFLAEGIGGNGTTNSTGCDEVCQIKSSLLEGVLVVSDHLHLLPFLFLLFCILLVFTDISLSAYKSLPGDICVSDIAVLT